MRYRENLNSVTFLQNKVNLTQQNLVNKIGIVYGIITTENTPTKKQFERAGGFNSIGAIFFKDFSSFNNNDVINDKFLDGCQIAKPYSVNLPIPLIGEVVNIKYSPSPASVLSKNAEQSYYTDIINIFGNIQHNSVSKHSLGDTFIEKSDVRNLIPFEGDVIFQGRKGNGLRFGSTTKNLPNVNEWSKVGEDGDPITILVNGYITSDTSSLQPNIEEINKELSSVYLTSTQLIPLTPDRNDILNPLTKPLHPNKYFSSQILMNSDRVVINSKKDEIMLFAKSNIELNTNNIINFNANDRIHLNSPVILLGTKDNKAPTEPLLLGNTTKELLNELISAIQELGNNLSSVITTPQGSPLTQVNLAGKDIVSKLNTIQSKLKNITSNSNFTV